ncbi:MAG TPA: lysine N(6)-hydroxylase/L-ornithine N(5)-oxygenase family protein [Acidimicrobiales bacterium]
MTADAELVPDGAEDGDDVEDVVGIGFGPSNLALAIAVDEHNRSAPPRRRLRATFLERQASFGWHRGMLLEDATMQVSFLKDLVTLRNPTSDFGFLSYLHERGRLVDFVNHKTLFPLRIEFHDYLEWAAARLDHVVRYGERVVGVRPLHRESDRRLVAFEVVSEGPEGRSTRRARNVVVAVGLTPRLPAGATTGSRVWHTRDLLPQAEALPVDPAPHRFVVVGSGQSAAEAVAFLHDRFPAAEVCSVFARYGYAPSDDSPFANRIFDPDAVDEYYGADDDVKRLLFDYHRNTNYSVVDNDLIEELYRREYRERVQGRRRLRVLRASRVEGVAPQGDRGVRVQVRSLTTRAVDTLDADALVYATGYQPVDPGTLLGEAGALLARRADGHPVVHRDYRLQLTRPCGAAALYVQGATEHSHGISSSLLSNVAVRSGEIVASVVARRRLAPVLARPVPAGVAV